VEVLRRNGANVVVTRLSEVQLDGGGLAGRTEAQTP